MTEDRFPDRGDVRASWPAVWAVEDLAGALWQSANDATGALDRLSPQVWSGHAADAFATSAAGIDDSARSTAEAWQRLAAAFSDYLTALARLQDEADTIRHRLTRAEEERDDLHAQLSRATAAARSGDPAAVARVSTLTYDYQDALRTVQHQWNQLAQISADRLRLDDRSATALLETPGPGAQAWSTLAYQHGRPRPVDEVCDDLADLVLAGDLTAEDYALIDQYLALHSADPEAMAAFYDRLGPRGLTDLLAGMSNDSPAFRLAGVRTLPERLRAGFVSASLTWDERTAQQWGARQIDRIAGADFGRTDDDRVITAWLLDTPGLNPQVALGALDRVEELRVEEPDTFARIAPDDDLLGARDRSARERFPAIFGGDPMVGPDLMGAVFGQLTRIPVLAREWFDEHGEGSTTYWFGERNWDGDQWEGPSRLLNTIVNDPGALEARADDPLGDYWSNTVAFASLAAERLGGNLNVRVGDLSSEASTAIARALGTFAPETAARFGSGANTDDGVDVVTIVVDGQEVEVPALTGKLGNLFRLLGIATTDPGAAAHYQSVTGQYATAVLDHLTGPDHPDLDKAKDLIYGVGGLYGIAWATGQYELTKHQELVSDNARQTHAQVAALAALIPGVETGRQALDYLIGLATGTIPDLTTALDPTIISTADLQAIIDAGLQSGNTTMTENVTHTLEDRWTSLGPDYDTSVDTLINRMEDGYSWGVGGATSDVSGPNLDVWVIGEGSDLEPRNRGDMP